MPKDKITYPEFEGDRRAHVIYPKVVDDRLAKLSKLERVFLKMIDLVARGEIIDISIDAEEDGTRVGTVRWKRK